jgi:hypothetical protein
MAATLRLVASGELVPDVRLILGGWPDKVDELNKDEDPGVTDSEESWVGCSQGLVGGERLLLFGLPVAEIS